MHEKKYILHYLLIFYIIVFTVGQVTTGSGDWAGEAKELMNSGEYQKALDVINNALSSGESKDLCYIQRGNIYKKMGDYQKAIDDYDKAISLNPAMPYYIAMKGDVYVLMGEYQKGIDLYDSALQKNIGYEPLVQSVKSSREEAYQKMKDATGKTELSQIPVSETPTIAQLETGSLSLVTVPQGAQVTLDGIIQDEVTPLTINDIDVGSHSITFSKSGYLDVSMTIPVIQSETSEFSISLSPESHEISSTSGDSRDKNIENKEESQGEDLIINEISMVYYKPDTEELTTDLEIKNIGNAPASHFVVTYFLTPEQIRNPFMDPDSKEIILGRDDISSLDPGKGRKASEVKIFSVSDIEPGIYWFGIMIDSQNSIVETNESNNVFFWNDQIPIKITDTTLHTSERRKQSGNQPSSTDNSNIQDISTTKITDVNEELNAGQLSDLLTAIKAGANLFKGNTGRTGEFSGPAVLNGVMKWNSEIKNFSSDFVVQNRVLYCDNTIYKEENGVNMPREKELCSVDGNSGKILWKQNVTDKWGSIKIDDNKFSLYHYPDISHIYTPTIDQGTVFHSFDNGGGISDQMIYLTGDDYALSNGILYTTYGGLYAIDMNSKAVLWKFTDGENQISRPSVKDDFVYAISYLLSDYSGSDDNINLVALDAKTGAVKWKFKSGWGSGTYMSPTVAEEMVIVGNCGSLLALNAKSGEIIWEYMTYSAYAPPVYAGGLIYTATSDILSGVEKESHKILAINAKSGSKVWEVNVDGRIYSLVIDDGVLYGYIYGNDDKFQLIAII